LKPGGTSNKHKKGTRIVYLPRAIAYNTRYETPGIEGALTQTQKEHYKFATRGRKTATPFRTTDEGEPAKQRKDPGKMRGYFPPKEPTVRW